MRPNLPLVPLDESLCEQAFVNIVQNAYDAMGANGGRLRVQVRRSRASGRTAATLKASKCVSKIPDRAFRWSCGSRSSTRS